LAFVAWALTALSQSASATSYIQLTEDPSSRYNLQNQYYSGVLGVEVFDAPGDMSDLIVYNYDNTLGVNYFPYFLGSTNLIVASDSVGVISADEVAQYNATMNDVITNGTSGPSYTGLQIIGQVYEDTSGNAFVDPMTVGNIVTPAIELVGSDPDGTVPEPSTLALLAASGALFLRRRRA
jgi:hypothetical protein